MLRKELLIGAVAGSMMAGLIAMPAFAAIDPLVMDVDPPGTETEFFKGGSSNMGWSGDDQNGSLQGQIEGSSETAEGNFLSALLGLFFDSPDRPSLISRTMAGSGGIGADDKSVTDLSGPTGWVFAVVKEDDRWWFFEDDGDGLLSTTTFINGISHITWFTPLPAAAWLMLTALAGLFGWRRWVGRSEPAGA